jgi:hypothetical protein
VSDRFAGQAFAKPLLDPESALRIPNCLTRDVIGNWTEYQRHRTWRDVPGHNHVKLVRKNHVRKSYLGYVGIS